MIVLSKSLKDDVTDIPDFPVEGIIFHDITSVIQSSEGLRLAVSELINSVSDLEFDSIAGIESRGFIFGSILAEKLEKGFVLVRKKGKLPRKTISEEYSLEYGSAEIEIHTDAVKPGERVLLIDDLIATGGTVKAAARLIERLGGEVAGAAFLIELSGLNGREALRDYQVRSVITYDGK